MPYFLLLVFLFLACQGFIFPNSTALAMAPLGHNAGNASALVGTIQMAIGATATAIVSVLHNHTAIPMAAVMCFCALAALVIFMLGRKIMIRRASEEITKEEDIEMISTL